MKHKSSRLLPVALVMLFVGAIFTILVPQNVNATTWPNTYTSSGCLSSGCFSGQKVEAVGGSNGADFYGLHPSGTTGPGAVSCFVSTASCNAFAAASTFSSSNVANYGFTRDGGRLAICTIKLTGGVEFAKNTAAWSTAQTVDSTTTTTGSSPGCGVGGFSATDWVVAYSDAGGHALTVRHSTNSGVSWTNPITGGGPIEANDINSEAVVTVVSASTWIVTYIVGTTPGVGSAGDLRSCKTTDTGATWACQTIAGSPNQFLHIIRSSGGRIFGSVARSSAMTFIFSDDNGDSWSVVAVGSEPGATLSIYDFSDNKIMMVWCAGTVGNPGGDNFLHDAVSATGGRSVGDWTVGSFLLTSATNNYGCSAYGLGVTTTGVAIAYIATAFTNSPTCSGCQSFRFIDEQAFGGTSSIGSIASRGVTNLVAFDADPYNQVIEARSLTTGSNTLINSYDSNSATLATRATAITSTCNQLDGIMAYSPTSNGKQFATWVDCDSTHQVVNNFHVRSGTLGSPDQSGTACDGNTICDIDMSGSDASLTSGCSSGYHLPDGALQLGNIQAIPVDWSTGSQTGINHVEVGFAYSNAANGNIGTWTIRQQTGTDDSCTVEVPFSSPSGTIEICSWRNQLDGGDYIAAIGSTSPTSAWKYHLTPYSATGGGLDTSLTAIPASLPAPYNHLIGIACVNNDALVMDTSGNYARVHIIGSSVGGVVWGPISLGGSATNRATAISRDNKWGLIASTTTVKVINALSGATTCTLTMPSGNFKEERISYSGQVAWIATDTNIAKYDIHTCTSGSPVVDGCVITNGVQTCYDAQGNVVSTGGNTGTGTSTSTSTVTGVVQLNTADNILGINIGATALGLNISRTAVLLLIAIVLMGVFGIWLYRNTDSVIGLIFGVFLGFLLSVAMALLPEWVMISVVLLLLIMLGKMLFGGFYPGGGEE